MTDKFIENAKNLSEVLKELLSVESEEESCCTAVFESIISGEDEENDNSETYQVTHVRGNTQHPLNHIATGSDKGFFLIGKAVIDTALNEDGDEELQVSVVELSRQKFERVLVGTPLSLEVVFINGHVPLHKGSSPPAGSRVVTARSQSCVQEWRLNNSLAIHPVEIGQARYLVSLFNHCLANGMSTVEAPFWVVVDENNTGTTTHLAALPQSDTLVNHVVVTCNGPYAKADTLPNFDSIKKLHNRRCHGTIIENSSNAYALYDLLGVSNAAQDEDQKSSAYVEFTWKDVKSLLQSPPLTSDCVLHIKCLPGSMQLTEFSLSSEVSKLICFNNMINDPDQHWPDPSSEEYQEVQGKMEKVLESLGSGEGFSQVVPDDDSTRGSTSTSPNLSDHEFAPRKDLDFTESLWLVLKGAVHFDDLIASLKIAMNALLNGFCQVVIHPSNKTHLAMFIRQLLQCETSEQRHVLRLKVERMFDDQAALKCLVGIGCEKLLRDHTNYFLSEELVTQDQLKYFMDGKIPLAEKVERVSKLQNVLDLIVTTKCILNTGHANLQLLTQSALMYYENHSSKDHPFFSLPLPAYGSSSISAVKSIISNEQPSVWCLALQSKSKKNTTTSVIQLSTESPLHATPDFNNDSKQDLTMSLTSKMPYYLSYAKQSAASLVASK